MEVVSDVASTFFHGIWNLFLKFEFPGLGVSLAAVLVSALLIRGSIRLFQYFTGFGASSSDYGRVADRADKIRRHKNEE